MVQITRSNKQKINHQTDSVSDSFIPESRLCQKLKEKLHKGIKFFFDSDYRILILKNLSQEVIHRTIHSKKRGSSNIIHIFWNTILPLGSMRHKYIAKGLNGIKFLLNNHYRGFVLAKLKQDLSYRHWIKKNEPSNDELRKQCSAEFRINPKISIIVPVYNTPFKYLKELFSSVISQTYRNWELCIVDGSDKACTRRENIISKFKNNSKIKYLKTKNQGISLNSNKAIESATGEFITFLDHDDVLAPFSLYEIVKAINTEPDVDLLYSDEDHLSIHNKRIIPYFKPDFNKELLRSTNYICHQIVVRKTIGDHIGWLRKEMDGSQDHDFMLRVTDITNRIVHIPKVLYHWREIPGSAAFDMTSKLYAFDAAKNAIRDHLKRNQLEGYVTDGHGLGYYRVFYRVKELPVVSIIIPNKDNKSTLETCISSIINMSTYHNYEILIIENNSTGNDIFQYYKTLDTNTNIRIIEWNKPFNYASINNYGATVARGEYLLFLNNDTQIINPDWIERMLEHFAKPEVGIVGAKLYFPNNTIEHAGFILGMCGYGCHSHLGYPRDDYGYFGRLKTVQNYTAVTGACLLTKRDIFERVGGFDEQFSYNYNDVDFCLKIKEKGYLTVWTPYAELYHHECYTRKHVDEKIRQKIQEDEYELFKRKWAGIAECSDPHYSPNLGNNFSIDI